MAVRRATILFPAVFEIHVYRTRNRRPTSAATRPIASNTLTDSNQSGTEKYNKKLINNTNFNAAVQLFSVCCLWKHGFWFKHHEFRNVRKTRHALYCALTHIVLKINFLCDDLVHLHQLNQWKLSFE